MHPEVRGWLDAFGLFMAMVLVVASIQGFIDRTHRHVELPQDALADTQNIPQDAMTSPPLRQ
jgi:hypothetical protein